MENAKNMEKPDYNYIRIPAFYESVFNKLTAEECKRLMMTLFQCMKTGEWPDSDADPKVCLLVKFLIYADLVEEMIDHG